MSFYYYLRKLEEFLISAGVLLMACLSIINVIGRTFFERSLASTEELTQFLIILVTFIGTSYAAGKARHIRMSAIYDIFGHHKKKLLTLFISGTTSLLMFLFCYYSVSYADTLQTLGTRSPAIGVPYFYVYAIAPFGLFLTGVEYALTFVRNLKEEEIFLSPTEKDQIYGEDE